MSASEEELKKMIRSFRCADLQSLLSFAGQSKLGKKHELQERALNLIKLKSSAIDMKIRELHNNRFNQHVRIPDPSDMYAPLHMNSASMGIPPVYPTRSSHHVPINGLEMPRYVVDRMQHAVINAPNLINSLPPHHQIPVHPKVKFRELPFYDALAELVPPTSLITLPNNQYQEKHIQFYLGPAHINQIQQQYSIGVQLRLCLLDTSCEQDDEIPPSITLKVNSKSCPVPNPIPTNKPGAEPKRPKKPIDITAYIQLSHGSKNDISLSWAAMSGKPYVMAVYLVQKQNSEVLIKRLTDKGMENPDKTYQLIRDKMNDFDSDIATTSLRASLVCPLGKIRMKLPCRAKTCNHLQCFDAGHYIRMNEVKPKWICPVCYKAAYFKTLVIDGLFWDIINRVPSECNEVQFHEDATYEPVLPVKKNDKTNNDVVQPTITETSKPKSKVEVISLSDSDNDEAWPALPPKKKMYKPSAIGTSTDNTHNSHKQFDVYTPYTAPAPESLLNSKSKKQTVQRQGDFDNNLPNIYGVSETSSVIEASSNFDPHVPSLLQTNGIPSSSAGFAETVKVSNDQNESKACPESFDLFSLYPEQDASYNYTSAFQENGPEIIDLE